MHKLYAEMDSTSWKSAFRQLYAESPTFGSITITDTKRMLLTIVTEQSQKKIKSGCKAFTYCFLVEITSSELERQREYMEHALTVLRSKAVKGETRLKYDIQRRITENIQLIK